MTAAPTTATIRPGDRLSLTLFLATAVHAILILGVSFSADVEERKLPSLDVVLVHTASETAAEQADYIAQADSQASGTVDERLRPASPVLGPTPAPTPGQAPVASTAAPAARPESLEHSLLTQERADRQVLEDQEQQPQEALKPGDSRAQLNLELARLTSELAEQSQRYAQRPRVSYLDTVSAKSAVEAAYIKAWVDRVERVGNLNYPDEARRRKLSGRLILHVLLSSEGEIVEASIGSPSGQQVLDDAAMRIVKLAAPFQAFSDEMREQYDQLMITRTWIFQSDGELMTR